MTPAARHDGDSRCPRCGQAFHCGAHDAAPCPCGSLTLPAELQQALRQRYHGCLCLACLRALAARPDAARCILANPLPPTAQAPDPERP